MYMSKTQIISVFFLCIIQETSAQLKSDLTVSEIYQQSSRLMSEKKFEESLRYLKNIAGYEVNTNDSLLYMKIKLLSGMYDSSAAYTRDLDTSLKLFSTRVNRYTFPELMYEETMMINTAFQTFKERDKSFYDSSLQVPDSKDVTVLGYHSTRLEDYLRSNPNSFYREELYKQYMSVRKQREKIISDSVHNTILRRSGKKSFLNIGYSVPLGNTKTAFTGFAGRNDALGFFTGNYTGGLGAKHSLNASLIDININIYTGARVKFAIDWHLLDAEYTVFDWSADSLLEDEKKWEKTAGKKDLISLKGGTRIGPEISVLLNKSIIITAYYNARPGVQFLWTRPYYESGGTNGNGSFEIEPKLTNFNLSHEVGMKFRFWGRVFLNPFYHFGYYTWTNKITTNTGEVEGTTNYKFGFAGLRLGF